MNKRYTQTKQQNRSRRVLMPRINLARCLVLLFLLVMAAVVYGGFRLIDGMLNIPVEQVVVEGNLHYQDKKSITQTIDRFVDNGFMQVDIARLHEQLSALPWTYKVVITRQTPNGLRIHIEEQKAVAYWNDDALINQYGDIFTPAQLPMIDGLPMFSGVKHDQVISLYQKLQATFAESQLPIKALNLNGRQTIYVTLANDMQLVMKLAKLEQQLNHWQQIANTLDTQRLATIERVDLRYSNGAAVKFKTPLASIGTIERGGHY